MRAEQTAKQLVREFTRGNRAALCLSVAVALLAGTLNLILSWLIQQLIDLISGEPDVLPLGTLAAIIGGFAVLCAAVYGLRCLCEPRFIEKAMRQYKDFAFARLTEKGIASFRAENTAAYLSALTNDAASVEADYLAQQINGIQKIVTFFGALALMLWYSPLLTLIAVLVTLLPLAASVLTGGRLQAAERRVSDGNRELTATLTDCLGGFAVVKTFKAEREIFRLFAERNRALEREKGIRRRLRILIGLIGALAGMAAQLGVFLAGAALALGGYALTAGAVILFVNLMNFMIEPIAELPTVLAGRRAARGLIDRLAELLETPDSTVDGDTLPPLQNSIVLDDVSFGYDGGKEVLHHVSAVFEAGKAYAVVGGSGSGKSTLLGILSAENTGYRGAVRFDGKELREVSPESLYEVLSVIRQDVFVFNASVRDNVTMFRDFPADALERAIGRAHLTDLLRERGEGYLCGENGSGLSGGEKQRISIARSLLKQSSVLLADEATSALDAQTAHQVGSDLLDLTGITRIVVTHTLEESLLRRYDGILVLKDGSVAESGRFDKLMAKKGYFYALYTVGGQDAVSE